MNTDVLSSALSVASLIFAAGIGWGLFQRGMKAMERSIEDETNEREKMEADVWREISKLREWRDRHEQESSRARLELEKEAGRIRELIVAKDTRLDEVLRRLEEMNKKIDRLEARD